MGSAPATLTRSGTASPSSRAGEDALSARTPRQTAAATTAAAAAAAFGTTTRSPPRRRRRPTTATPHRSGMDDGFMMDADDREAMADKQIHQDFFNKFKVRAVCRQPCHPRASTSANPATPRQPPTFRRTTSMTRPYRRKRRALTAGWQGSSRSV